MKSELFNNFRGDLSGGVTSSLMALPESMVYGTLVFSILGPEYIPFGIMAGIAGLAFLNIGSSAIGGVRIMNSGPFSLTSLMLAATLTALFHKLSPSKGFTPEMLFPFLFLAVFLAGLIQSLFGVLKLGNLAKYFPYPVLSALLNGTAILIFIGQIKPLLGLNDKISYSAIINDLSQINLLSLLTGLITSLAIWKGDRLTKKIPASFLGIIAGTGFHYLMNAAGFFDRLGPVIGPIPGGIPSTCYVAGFIGVLADMDSLDIIFGLLPQALGIAFIVSLRSLIAAISADNLTQDQSRTNRELVAQGFGNMLSSIFGGITGAGSVSRTIANYKYGGRTGLSRFIAGLFAFLLLVALYPVVGLIPKAVLAGMLVILSIISFDKWSLELVKTFIGRREFRKKEMFIDLGIVLSVTICMIAVGIFEALALGLVLSVIMFVVFMGKSIIHREFTNMAVRSNAIRPQHELDLLEKNGHKIVSLELEGVLFFGTADQVLNRVKNIIKSDIDYIILDFKRVTGIDSTGAHVLLQLITHCGLNKKTILFSSIMEDTANFRTLDSALVLKGLGKSHWFESLVDALLWSEDDLLYNVLGVERYSREVPLAEVDILKRLGREELAVLVNYMERKEFRKGEIIVREGDSGNSIFFLIKGRAKVFVDLDEAQESSRKNRISTLFRGTIFGEMSFLDNKPRSASVEAEEDCACFFLSNEKVRKMHYSHPDIAYKILIDLGRVLSERIRIKNAMVKHLAD